MRLSSLSFAAVLLFSSIVCAQHHEAGSAPSPPPASPAPSAVPSASPSAPAAAPVPSVSTSAPSAMVSHSSAPGTSAPTNSGSTASHASISPDQKNAGEGKIVSAPRIGQDSPEKNPVMKPGPPDLRHRICDSGLCKEQGTEWRADPPRSDLRRRICLNGPCPCPPGQKADKGECIANPPVAQPLVQCQPGGTWNGTACTPSSNCAPGELWNGASCVASANECSSIDGRAAILVNELRGIKAQIQDVCGQNPSGQDCENLKQRQREALQRYQMLLSEAAPRCQRTLEDPGSLE